MTHRKPQDTRLLLVEDEAIVALSEKKILEKHGYEVIIAHSGEKAVETATQDTGVDLVLMDIDLGSEIDGTQAAELILQARSLPIVFLTSHAEKEYVERVKSITNYGYVLKGSGEFVINESINMALQLFEAHQETAHKEERLSFVIDEAPVGIFQSSSDGTFRHLNSEMAHILGFDSREEALHYYTDIGQQMYVSQQRRNELLKLVEEHGVVRDFRFEIVRVTGEKAYLKMNAHRVPNGVENEMLLNNFVIDETERCTAERKLEESQKQYQSVVDLAQEIIVRHDIQGKWTFVNEAACRFFRQTREALIGQHYMDFVHPEDQEKAETALRTMTDNGQSVERMANRQWTPGGYRTVEWNSSPLIDEHGRYSGHQSTGRDITGEARLRDEVEHEGHKWRELFEQATVGIFLADREHRIVESNPTAAEMLGYSRDELRGMNASQLIHPDDLEYVLHAFREGITYQQEKRRVEYRFRCADGSYIWVETDGTIIKDEEGSSREVLYSARDVTERKQTEEALRKSRKQLETIFNSARDAIYIHDLDGNFLETNDAACKQLGYSKSELRHMTVSDIDNPVHRLGDSEIKDQLQRDNAVYLETEHIKKSGDSFPVELSLVLMEYYGMPAVLAVSRDISKRKEVEEQLEEMYARLQTVIDNVPFLINEIDVNGYYRRTAHGRRPNRPPRGTAHISHGPYPGFAGGECDSFHSEYCLRCLATAKRP